MNKKKGLFISFEGPEASGKSSQIFLLQKYLTKKKIPFFTPKLPDNPKCIHSELISKSKGTKAGKSLC